MFGQFRRGLDTMSRSAGLSDNLEKSSRALGKLNQELSIFRIPSEPRAKISGTSPAPAPAANPRFLA